LKTFADEFFSKLGRPLVWGVYSLGDFSFFFLETMKSTFQRPFRIRLFFKEMERIGVQSILIIALVGAFSGMVFALQTGSAFRLFNAESLVGSTVGVAITRELAPVFTALMIVARAGSAMAAEIGTMQVTEQVDALKSMGIPPINYLVVPRVLAATVMVPLLTALFNGVGMAGAYLVAVDLLQIPAGPYIERFKYYVDANDLYQGLIKAVFFGFLISLIACYKGYGAKNGAEGVGKATTQAVVAGSVCVLILNYFLATWLLKIFPDYYHQ
jgi:phospholipid/cholesterol/gamma-HCH transport system permease protein